MGEKNGLALTTGRQFIALSCANINTILSVCSNIRQMPHLLLNPGAAQHVCCFHKWWGEWSSALFFVFLFTICWTQLFAAHRQPLHFLVQCYVWDAGFVLCSLCFSDAALLSCLVQPATRTVLHLLQEVTESGSGGFLCRCQKSTLDVTATFPFFQSELISCHSLSHRNISMQTCNETYFSFPLFATAPIAL